MTEEANREPYSFERLNNKLSSNKTLLAEKVWPELKKLASVISMDIPDNLFDTIEPASGKEESPAGMVAALDRAHDLQSMIDTVASYLINIGRDLYPEKYD